MQLACGIKAVCSLHRAQACWHACSVTILRGVREWQSQMISMCLALFARILHHHNVDGKKVKLYCMT